MCQSQAAALQDIVDAHPEWDGLAQVVMINQAGTESGLPDLTDGVSVPVLQDPDRSVFQSWGATKWYIYVLSAEGELSELHYHLDLAGAEAERLVTDVQALLGGRR